VRLVFGKHKLETKWKIKVGVTKREVVIEEGNVAMGGTQSKGGG
jgi:hypothetical protein